MTPFDCRLPVIAAAARVKTCHVWHQWSAMREMGGNFHKEAFAQFAGLEVKHVDAILSALQEHDCLPTRTARTSSVGKRLPDDWEIPQEWADWASKERKWHPADVRKEAEVFANHWQSKSGKDAAKLDWRKTWMNWVRSGFKQDGDYVPEVTKISSSERAEFLRKSIAYYESEGRHTETEAWKIELARLEPNVLPFERKAG